MRLINLWKNVLTMRMLHTWVAWVDKFCEGDVQKPYIKIVGKSDVQEETIEESVPRTIAANDLSNNTGEVDDGKMALEAMQRFAEQL